MVQLQEDEKYSKICKSSLETPTKRNEMEKIKERNEEEEEEMNEMRRKR